MSLSSDPIIRCIVMCALCSTLALNNSCSDIAGGSAESTPYRVETLVGGGPMHGAKGITFGPDGMLYVGTVNMQTIYRVDISTGEVTIAVGAPHGESDDVAFAPDGTMAWTALPSGEIRALQPGGEPYVLADKLMLINPLGYTDDGRLFAAQIGIDRFLEIDVTGEKQPRLVAKGIGHLNSFSITTDNHLYGPLAGKEQVARINLQTGTVEIIADNLGMLSAVEQNSQGQIYAVGWSSGQLWRIDANTRTTELVATLDPPVDNIAIAANGSVYASQPAKAAIVKINPTTGDQTVLVPGNISIPGGLALSRYEDRETLILADDFGFRLVDTLTGNVSATVDLADFMDPAAATDVAVTDNVIVLSDVTRSRVYMVDRATAKTTHKWKNIKAPYGVVVTKSGDPVVAEFASGQLIRLSKSDRKSREIIASGLDGPVGLAWAGPGSVYVTEALSGELTRVDLNDGSMAVVATGLRQPEGLAVLADGRVVVVEAGAQQVTRIDPASGDTALLAQDLPLGLAVPNTPAPVHVPSGIAVGEDGALYLSSDLDHSVLKLTP